MNVCRVERYNSSTLVLADKRESCAVSSFRTHYLNGMKQLKTINELIVNNKFNQRQYIVIINILAFSNLI